MTDDIMDKIKEDYGDELETKEGHKEKVEPVTKAIEDMGTMWKQIIDKLIEKDNICYLTKEELAEDEPFDIVRVPDHKVDKGMIAFVCVAKKNNQEEKTENE